MKKLVLLLLLLVCVVNFTLPAFASAPGSSIIFNGKPDDPKNGAPEDPKK